VRWGSLLKSQVARQAGAYLRLCRMKRLEVFLLPPGWDACPIAGLPPALNSSVPIYSLGRKRPCCRVRVKCPSQENNTNFPARARTQTVRPGVERTNHEAIVPPRKRIQVYNIRMIAHLRHVAKARLALRCTNWIGNPLKVCPSGIALLMACWNSSFPAETPVLCSNSYAASAGVRM